MAGSLAPGFYLEWGAGSGKCYLLKYWYNPEVHVKMPEDYLLRALMFCFLRVPVMAPVGQALTHAPQRIHSGELGFLQTSMSILQLPEHLPHLMHFDESI